MKRPLLLLLLLSLIISNAFAQATFQKRYGGHGNETMTGLAHTYDGGYVMSGGSASFGDTTGDVYLVKTDTSGNLLWSVIYHGDSSDYCDKVIETADHGLLLAGNTYSFGSGSSDAFLLKTDSAGKIEWSKVYGGTQYEFFLNIRQTYDGGYVAVGGTASFGAGDNDMLIIRTNATGDTLWTRILGGIPFDQATDIIQTADSNFVITGRTASFGLSGFPHSFLCKLNQSGDTLWARVFGNTGQEEAMSVKQTYDGGYIVTGSSNSFGSSGYDAYLNRFDSTGHLFWSKLYTGPLTDATYNVLIMPDSGFALLGFTDSFGPPLSSKQNNSSIPARVTGDDSSNVYIIRTDANGDTLWVREYGGVLQDESYGLLKTTNDGLVILGFSNSFGTDGTDAYLIKTDADGNSGCHEKATYPVVSSPNTVVVNAPMQIASGVSVLNAPFTQFEPATLSYVICPAVGIADEEAIVKDFILYPNPANSQLNIQSSSFSANEEVTVSIENVLGQETLPPASLSRNERDKLRRGENAIIDISNLPAGIYFLKMNWESPAQGGIVKKFVKSANTN